MKKIITGLSLVLSMSSFAGINKVLTLADLVDQTKQYNEESYEVMGEIPESCRSVTKCTTDFKGNTTCSVELVCDIKK